jgi:hypothetical protein
MAVTVTSYLKVYKRAAKFKEKKTSAENLQSLSLLAATMSLCVTSVSSKSKAGTTKR